MGAVDILKKKRAVDTSSEEDDVNDSEETRLIPLTDEEFKSIGSASGKDIEVKIKGKINQNNELEIESIEPSDMEVDANGDKVKKETYVKMAVTPYPG